MTTEWKLVPVEPTAVMTSEGDRRFSFDVDKIYAAMIAAAPVPPAGGAVDRASFEAYYADLCGLDASEISTWRKGDGYSGSYERCAIAWDSWKSCAARVSQLQAEVERFKRANSSLADDCHQANVRAIAAEELLDAGPSYADGTHPNQYAAELESEIEEAREQLELIGNLIPEEYEPNGSELDCLTAYLGDLQSRIAEATAIIDYLSLHTELDAIAKSDIEKFYAGSTDAEKAARAKMVRVANEPAEGGL